MRLPPFSAAQLLPQSNFPCQKLTMHAVCEPVGPKGAWVCNQDKEKYFNIPCYMAYAADGSYYGCDSQSWGLPACT